MEDHGQLITHFESIFGDIIDHEVIKIILQVCSWNSDEAYEKLLNLIDGSSIPTNKSELSENHSDDSTSSESKTCNLNSDESCGKPLNLTNGSNILTAKSELSDSYSDGIYANELKANNNYGTVSMADILKMKSETSNPGKLPKSMKSNSNAKCNFNDSKRDELLAKLEKIKYLIEQKYKVFIIMRGLPGSGKSTLANNLKKNGVVLSTDDYFYDKYNNYNYNPSILVEAHNWNKDRAKLKIFKGITPIFIDNTNLEIWEFIPYLKWAVNEGYYVDLLEPETDWRYNCKELSRKCIHNVPRKKIKEMSERFNSSLTIDKVLEKMNLKNNNPYKVAPVLVPDDPDIVIEDSDSLEEERESSSENEDLSSELEEDNSEGKIELSQCLKKEEHSEFEGSDLDNKTDITVEVFNDLVNNFNEALKKHLNKDDLNISNEEKNKEEVETLHEDEVMYQFFNDYEDKIGKPFLSPESKEAVEQESVNGNCDEQSSPKVDNNDSMEEWDCIDNMEDESIQTVWDSKKAKKLDGISNEARPQRSRRRIGGPLYCIDEFGLPDQLEPDETDEPEISAWVPLETQKVSWEEDDSKWKGTGAIPKKLPNSEQDENCKENDFDDCMKLDKTTQYVTSDYVNPTSELKIITGNPEAFVIGPMEIQKENEPLTKSKLMLHKSSMTEETIIQSECETLSPLSKLIRFFPSIAADDLSDVLEKCDYDIDWAVNILIDGGYNISSLNEDETEVKNILENYHENKRITKQFDGENEVLDLDDLKVKTPQVQKKSQNSPKISPDLSTQSEIESEAQKGAQYLCMEIDPMFATHLINIYGPISSLNLMSGFTKEDRRIVLPLEVCHLIYKYWSETLDRQFKDNCDVTDKFVKEDEKLARILQNEENSKGESKEVDAFKLDPPTSFREICDLEKALVLSNVAEKGNEENKDCSTVLSLLKLQEEYKHVDPSAVEDEFYALSYDYKATKTVLGYKYGGNKAEPKTVLAPGTTVVREGNDDDDDDEEDDDDDIEEEYEITVTDPKVFRDEAQMHYLERNKALQKAKEASQNGMKAVAGYYADIGNRHLIKFKEANERASKKILNAVNSNKGPNTLDLHLLHVNEALKAAQSFLAERTSVMRNRQLKTLRLDIITGKGNHSINGEARLKPAIRYFLSAEGYGFEEHAGMFKVTLRS